jgi:hypothetical protein
MMVGLLPWGIDKNGTPRGMEYYEMISLSRAAVVAKSVCVRGPSYLRSLWIKRAILAETGPHRE